jgi:uncharacterized protein (DUF983 family)
MPPGARRKRATRGDVLLRALLQRCPKCGQGRIFARGFTMAHACPVCGLGFERGDGFFLGAMSLNYGVTVCCVLSPIALLWMADVLPGDWAVGLGVAAAALFPIVFYRWSRSLWLGFYFFFLLHELRQKDGE